MVSTLREKAEFSRCALSSSRASVSSLRSAPFCSALRIETKIATSPSGRSAALKMSAILSPVESRAKRDDSQPCASVATPFRYRQAAALRLHAHDRRRPESTELTQQIEHLGGYSLVDRVAIGLAQGLADLWIVAPLLPAAWHMFTVGR